MDLSKLKEPFPFEDLEFRLQSCGEKNGKIWAKYLTYVTNRAICNRLDEVVGPENWKNEFCAGPNGGVLCGISIRINNEFITKWDGAENTNIEAVKGGLSGAMKRAASTGWGIGRYLYKLPESWAVICEDGQYSGRTKEGKWFNWKPAPMSEEFLPSVDETEFESLKQSILDYINTDIIKGDLVGKAEKYVAAKNISKLKEIIAWCKTQERKGA